MLSILKNTKVVILISLFILLVLSGCKKEEPMKQPDTEKEVEKEVEETTVNRHPLTGVEFDGEVAGRAIAVTINNEVSARPQSGVMDADIVIEMLTEASITRFLAIYQSTMPEKIGPVRSAREYFVNLAKGYNALFIAHGYSPEAKEMLMSGEIDHINGMQYDGTLFKRASFRKAPHNSYITSEAIYSGAEQLNYSMEQPPTAVPIVEQVDVTGETVDAISIAYDAAGSYNAEYRYNQDGYYTRFQADEQTIDYETEQEIQLQNILIVEAEHQVMDNKGRRKIDFTSGGKGYLLQNGKMQEVEWKYEDGMIIPSKGGFVPGKTWINFVPNLDIVSVVE